MTPSTPRRRPISPLLHLALAAAALLPACDYDHGHHIDFWPITVDNRTGITLDIQLDGDFRVTVSSDTLGTIPGVREGVHLLEAFDPEGTLRASRSFFLASEFVWVLE